MKLSNKLQYGSFLETGTRPRNRLSPTIVTSALRLQAKRATMTEDGKIEHEIDNKTEAN